MLGKLKLALFCALLLLSSCSQNDGFVFTKCKNISDAFSDTFPNYGGCSVNEVELLKYFDERTIKYRLHENKDGSLSHLIGYANQNYGFGEKNIARLYVINGPLAKFPQRKEDYALFVGEGGKILAILPRYAYFGP